MLMKTLRRISLLTLSLLLALTAFAGDKVSFLKRQFTANNGQVLNYRVLFPLDYDPAKSYPLLLFLHGAGERGTDNEAQLKHGCDMLAAYATQKAYPAIILVPQCPPDPAWWVDYSRPKEEGGKRVFPVNAPITRPLAAVKQLLDSYIAKGIVDTKRIYVTGLSMGGMGTFDLVCRYPNLFAAAAPICGGVNPVRLANFKGKTAFAVYHGADDTVVDVQFSRDAVEALKKAGVEVRYKEYPGVNHNSWDNAFAEPDFLGWLFSHSL